MKRTARRAISPFKRVLVPFAFSDQSLAALRTARMLAGAAVARLGVLHVAERIVRHASCPVLVAR